MFKGKLHVVKFFMELGCLRGLGFQPGVGCLRGLGFQPGVGCLRGLGFQPGDSELISQAGSLGHGAMHSMYPGWKPRPRGDALSVPRLEA
ncbi:hypothetical protein Q31b_51880 [Novipirellula aureliae]|uniref:Uncharacterized protein n=1 Tax=Novipirellula aureliae TaxID=2527966 RepID=A0A5C6DET1_9BACT|nr:hypothetical protein Q31b_51880 [Novipirellula aureliae]